MHDTTTALALTDDVKMLEAFCKHTFRKNVWNLEWRFRNGLLKNCNLDNEGLFNADCSVALLLDTIKKRHQLSRQDTVDLYSVDGHLKHLPDHLTENGATFFELRELCIVVRVTSTAADSESSVQTYVPALEEYCKDEDFMATLTSSIKGHHSSEQGKSNKHHPSHRAGLKPPTPDGGKGKGARGKRRGSTVKVV